MGFVASSRGVILFLNSLNPFQGLLVYYLILYSSLYVLSKMDLVIFGFKIDNPLQTLGLLLITFSFFITVNWESAYVQYISTGSFGGTSTVFLQSEDGATFWFWSTMFPSAEVEFLRILTFVVTPFVLTIIGSLFVSKKIELESLS